MMQVFAEDDMIGNERLMYNTLLDAVHAAGGHVVGCTKHEFDPIGLSSVVLLADSHASLHTWPEENLGLVDYFSCAVNPNFDEFVKTWEDRGFLINGRQEIER